MLMLAHDPKCKCLLFEARSDTRMFTSNDRLSPVHQCCLERCERQHFKSNKLVDAASNRNIVCKAHRGLFLDVGSAAVQLVPMYSCILHLCMLYQACTVSFTHHNQHRTTYRSGPSTSCNRANSECGISELESGVQQIGWHAIVGFWNIGRRLQMTLRRMHTSES